MLVRLAYLAVTNAFAALRLLPMGDRDKDVEILVLRHQITVLQRQLGSPAKVRFTGEDRAFLTALLTSLGTTTHPTVTWVAQAIRNLVMDLQDAGCRPRYLSRDRDGNFPALIQEILAEARIQTVLTGVRMPRMNSIMERWVQTCRRELLDRCLLWNEPHLRRALREYEDFYNRHRAHQALRQAAPLRAVPVPIADPEQITGPDMRPTSSTSTYTPLELHG
ncbi:integrase core domain-containing protein [Streptosporangiaceae bacterium NEAU-GS5]|nr:integrase core domain-containing protein [Streptosporangiaceae bacterium NEAU-GS5]